MQIRVLGGPPRLLVLGRKQVGALELGFRESRDRVTCINPTSHWCPLSPAAGDGCLPAGIHWCYRLLRIHSSLQPIGHCTTNNRSSVQLESAAVTAKSAQTTSPPASAAPQSCPSLRHPACAVPTTADSGAEDCWDSPTAQGRSTPL